MIGFFYPVLWGGKLFFNFGFTRTEDMPIHFWFGEALKRGSWRINPLYFAGVPSYLSQTDLLHPLSLLLYKLKNSISIYHWFVGLSFLGQWYGFYVFSRKLKISVLSAVFASFVWVFNQWNIQLGNMEILALFLVWVPVLFFLAIKINESQNKFLYSVLAAILLAPNWVFSLAQGTLYLATALIIFAAFLDFQSVRFSFFKYKNTVLWVTIVLLSVVIVSPILKADHAIYDLGWRSGGLSYQKSVNDYFNIFDLAHFISPFILLRFVNTEYTHFYAGILPLFLFILTWKFKNKDLYIRFFIWMAVLTLLIAVKYSPLFYIMTKIPIFNLFRGSGKTLFLFSLSAAVLSGFGLDMLKETQGINLLARILKIYRRLLIAFGVLIVAVSAGHHFLFDRIVKMGFKLFMQFGYSRTVQREAAYYLDKVRELLNSWFYQFSFLSVEVWLMIITLALTGLIAALLIKKKVSFTLFSILAVVLTCFSSFFIWHRYYSFVPDSVLDPTLAIQFLMKHNDPRYRTLTFNLGIESYKKMGLMLDNPKTRYQFEVATLTSDVFMYYNIETLNGHDALLTRRQEFFSDFNSQFATQQMTIDEKRKLFESYANLISMMNVKHVLSSVPLTWPFIKRFESNIAGTGIPLDVYENTTVLPKIYFAGSASYIKENQREDDLWQYFLRTKKRNFGKETVVECDDCSQRISNENGKIKFETYQPDEINLDVKRRNNSWLVFSNSYLPGWKAFVDGQEIRIYRANYFFQTIQVPAGSHKIKFIYKIL